jgi:hypothetical protein
VGDEYPFGGAQHDVAHAAHRPGKGDHTRSRCSRRRTVGCGVLDAPLTGAVRTSGLAKVGDHV